MPPFVPIIAMLGAVGAAAYFMKGKGATSNDPAIEAAMPLLLKDRAAAMAKLADILYRVIAKKGFTTNEPEFACQIADRVFGLSKTVQGIRTSKGLPTDERWPGSNLSVSQYMYEYTQAQVPKVPSAGSPTTATKPPSAIDRAIAAAPQVKNTIAAIANIFKK